MYVFYVKKKICTNVYAYVKSFILFMAGWVCVCPCVMVYVLNGIFISVRFEEVAPPGCEFCHIPYDELNIPFPAQLTYCCCCRRYKVPDVLFTTIDLPTEANITGKGCLIQAR